MTPPAGHDGRGATIARTLAQAKVNLFLHVLAREDNGYHQIETLFCRLDLGDDVIVRAGGRGRSLDVTGGAVPADGLGPVEHNLAWRAAQAFSARAGWPNDWAIELRKRIPVGGGLGGGSADAGAVLRCLNALAPTPLEPTVLLAIAASLGADVPYLSTAAPLSLAWGRGDRLLTLPGLPARDVALACVPFGVPTPDAYRWIDDVRSERSAAGASLALPQLASWREIAVLAHNDFERVVAPRFPVIAATLETWRSLDPATPDVAPITLLSGSGSTVVRIADDLAGDVGRGLDPTVRVTRTRTASRVVGVEVSD
jgi:4-diphosphocytidyl-2-C-methyl-D-erythritol kinase